MTDDKSICKVEPLRFWRRYVAWFGADARGARRNFFRGGKRSIHYLLDGIKPYSCSQDFAKGFEPIVKMILLKRCCNLGGMLSKLMQFKCVMDGGLGKSPQSQSDFRNFFIKITTLTSFRSHFERFF